MKKYISENKLLLIAYILSVPVAAVCSSLTALLTEPLIDVIYTQNHADFIKYSLLEVLMVLLDLLSHYFHKTFREKLRVYYVTGLKRDIFKSLLQKSIIKYQENTVAQYLSLINRDVGKMNECWFDAVCGIYRVIINFIINLSLILYLSPWIALLNIGTSFLSVLVPHMFERRLTQKQEQASAKSEKYYSLLNDYLNGFSTIKIFHIQDKIFQKYEKSNREAESANCDSVLTNYSVSWISGACSELSYAVTLALGVFFCLNGKMTVGMVITLSQLIGGIVVPFEELPEYITNIKSIKSISGKIQSLLQTAACHAGPSTESAASDEKAIVLDHVGFGYSEDKLCLQNVSFELRKGEKCILIGDSGSGKSTLAKLIAGFYPCSQGTIRINGAPLEKLPESQLYRRITYIEQNVFLLEDTLYNNIVLYQEYSDEKVKEAISMAGLSEFVSGLPQGLHTAIHASGDNLSGGEKQRIGIARALLTGADFMIMDEVTANLDPIMEKQVEEAIWSLHGPGILYITHHWEESFLCRADHVLKLQDGILEEQCEKNADLPCCHFLFVL